MTSLALTRTVSASPDRVWLAWTEPTELAAWMWPPSFETRCEIDLRLGGRYRIESETARMAVSGEYVEIAEPTRLVFTWQWDGEDEITLVTVTLTASGPGTELRVDHERFAGDETRASHEQGWNDCLDRLPAHLAG